jgi:hypothetical protein
MNEIFLCRGSDNRISSQRAIIVDLRSLSRLSRGFYTFNEILSLKWGYFLMKMKDKRIKLER